MCTVTLVAPKAGHLRLVFSRDEQRSRAASTPPREVELSGRRAVMPIDPESAGTWIGASDAGLVVCLLNANPPERSLAWAGRRSRGSIVPSVLAAGSVEGAGEIVRAVRPEEFPPFRMLIISATGCLRASSDGAQIDVWPGVDPSRPFMLTSSGLGDHVVAAPRREAFRELFAGTEDVALAQQQLHQHARAASPETSVLMSRADARTVSRTEVDLWPDRVHLRHVRLDEALRDEAEPVTLGLVLRPRAVPA